MDIKAKSILIIDDDPEVRLATRTLLELADYKIIVEAENGDAGLARIRENPPALVLLDRKMPGKDGLVVLEEIKEAYGDQIEVIMLTAYRDKKFIIEAMRKSAFYYMVKDENPDYIPLVVERALRHQQKSMQRKKVEREIFEWLVGSQNLIANGYDFEFFKDVLRDKIGGLVEGVVQTAVTGCVGCRNAFCKTAEMRTQLPQFQAKLLTAARGDHPPLFILSRQSRHPFFQQALQSFVPETRRPEVQTLIYVPFVDHPSPPLLKILDDQQTVSDLMYHCCIYIFSTQPEDFTPEEKKLLRSSFDRFLTAIRMAKLVGKIETWSKNRLLGEMAAMVVHQISPLITPLTDCLQMVDGEKRDHGLFMIRDLQRMVDDFRAYSQGIVKDYHSEQLDLVQIIQQAETLLFLQTEQAITVQHHFPEQSPLVQGDQARLRQVFDNLLTNAAQAIMTAKKSNGRIEITMKTKPNAVEVRITDNGPGIPVEVTAKLFSSYISTKNGGMGLGLSLVHEILRRHGGKIEHNSQYMEGTEFIITLPTAISNGTFISVEAHL